MYCNGSLKIVPVHSTFFNNKKRNHLKYSVLYVINYRDL